MVSTFRNLVKRMLKMAMSVIWGKPAIHINFIDTFCFIYTINHVQKSTQLIALIPKSFAMPLSLSVSLASPT